MSTASHYTQHIDYEPENLRGRTFHEKVIRHPSSPVNTSNIGAETDIVHIGRKYHNECAVVNTIGAKSQKALWNSGADRFRPIVPANDTWS